MLKCSTTQDVAIHSLVSLVETRDPETGGHIQRTRHYIRALAEHLKDHPRFEHALTDDVIEQLFMTAPLHDIGKAGVRDHILLKPDRLDDAEFEEMKRHTVYGRNALAAVKKALGDNAFLRYALEIAYSHQEKWDGSGYPLGLSGEDIPLSARLMAVADVYDALISRRVYKPAYPHAVAVRIMAQGRKTHFDPDILDAFLAIQDEFACIAAQYADAPERHP